MSPARSSLVRVDMHIGTTYGAMWLQAYFLEDLFVYIGLFARHEWLFAIHHIAVLLCAAPGPCTRLP